MYFSYQVNLQMVNVGPNCYSFNAFNDWHVTMNMWKKYEIDNLRNMFLFSSDEHLLSKWKDSY